MLNFISEHLHLDASVPRSSSEEECVRWLLLRCVSYHPLGDDLTVSPSVRETLERMRIDGLVCKRWPSQPAFFHASAYIICLGSPCIYVSCLIEQQCVIAFCNYVLFPSLPVFIFCRLAKEEIAYKTEAKQQEEKVERLKTEGADDYLIKKQVCGSFFNTTQLRVFIWKPLHYPFIIPLISASKWRGFAPP